MRWIWEAHDSLTTSSKYPKHWRFDRIFSNSWLGIKLENKCILCCSNDNENLISARMRKIRPPHIIRRHNKNPSIAHAVLIQHRKRRSNHFEWCMSESKLSKIVYLKQFKERRFQAAFDLCVCVWDFCSSMSDCVAVSFHHFSDTWIFITCGQRNNPSLHLS